MLDPDNAFMVLDGVKLCETSDGYVWLGLYFTIGSRVEVAILFPHDTADSVAFYARPAVPDEFRGDFTTRLNWYLEGFCYSAVVKTEKYLLSPRGFGFGDSDIRK